MMQGMKKIVSILVCLLCFGCSAAKESKPKILVTIPPYAGLAKSLVGDSVDVEIFVLPGADPHKYEPSPEQIRNFLQAKIWFRTGDPIETKMADLMQERDIKVIDLSQKHELLTDTHSHGDHMHEEKDLHLWMNPVIVQGQVEEMTRALITQFPELEHPVKLNSAKLRAELHELDLTISSKLAPFEGAYLLVSHPALGYYCERYKLHQFSVEIEGKEPLPQDIAHLMSGLKEHPVPVVLTEPQYNKKGAELIAEKLHLPLEEINPYSENYFEMLNHLTDVIVKYYGPARS